MSAADDLRALTAVATPGPWEVDHDENSMAVAQTADGTGIAYDIIHDADAELIVWLVNHAAALADLIDAVGEMPIHGSYPDVSYCFICKNDAPCATERAQLAVAALDADR